MDIDQKLYKHLEGIRKDCIQLKEKEQLTKEGEGMLMIINEIYEIIGFKIEDKIVES